MEVPVLPPVHADFYILAITAATGVALGLVYDCWQVVIAGSGGRRWRGRRRERPIPVWYWLAAAGLTWCVLSLVLGGMMRGFMFLGLGAGATVYALVLSGYFRRLLFALQRTVVLVLSGLFDAVAAVVLFPVRLVLRVLGAAASIVTSALEGPGRLVLAAADWATSLGARALKAVSATFRRPKTRD